MFFTIGMILAAVSAAGLLINSEQGKNKICSSNELSNISGDGVILSKNIRLLVAQSNEHVLMVTPSGAG